ncbi:hypothetical protein F4677DRAFT_261391 [Hypoxylon crocopeplum]|nr:hypothetical protein F4677DRAFT_261391 [Hypoxylon crocopeplum]
MDSLQSSNRPTAGKLRTSCDRCQDTKVRCDQEKPECQRCAKKGLQCIYSPTKRFGRPRKDDVAARRTGLEGQRARSLHPQRRQLSSDASVNQDAILQGENTASTASSVTDTATLDDPQ